MNRHRKTRNKIFMIPNTSNLLQGYQHPKKYSNLPCTYIFIYEMAPTESTLSQVIDDESTVVQEAIMFASEEAKAKCP